jgi:putative ABC transport system permease protein
LKAGLLGRARMAANVLPVGVANLFQHKVRVFTALAGIAVALFLLVLQYESLHAIRVRVAALYSFFNFDIALVPDSYQILNSPGTLDRVRLSQARTVPQVERTYGIGIAISDWAQRHKDNGNAVLLIGLDDDPRFIRDPAIRYGMSQLTDGRSILFDTLAQADLRPFSIGHIGKLGGDEVQIKGLFDLGLFFYAPGAAVVPSSMFTRLSDRDSRQITVGLLQIAPGADAEEIKRRLQAVLPDDVQVLTRQELIAQEQAYFVDTKPIGIMMDIGMLIACLVAVTIMIQVLSTEIGNRMNEYAVLKAMGFGPLFIYAIGLTQAAILGIAGLIPALVVAALVLHFIQSATHLGAQLGPQLAGMALLVALGTGLVAASAVMWRVGRADPAELY